MDLEQEIKKRSDAPQPQETEERTIYTPEKLPENEIDTLLSLMPQDRKTIFPLYRMSVLMKSRADQSKGPEARTFLDKATLFDDLATRLMFKKAPGWDGVYVSYLREYLAVLHPELNEA